MARRFLSPAFWVQLPIKQTIDELIICLRLSANEVVDLIVETLCGWEEHSLKKLAWVCFRTPTSDITCTTWGDLSPLVDRCAASTDPDVRALAWRIWVGTSAARAEQVGLLDPEVEWLWRSAPAGGLTWWHDDPARRPEPPPELTEVMARHFPALQSPD